MTAHSPLFSPLLRLRFLSALFLLSVLFPPGGHAQTQPSISLSCSPTLIVAGQDVTITATISPSTATPDSDLTVSVTDIGYGITHTDPVIPAGEYQGTGTVTDTDGARGQHISVPFHAPAGYSHGGSCSFTVAGGGTPPPPPPPTVTLSLNPTSFAENDSATGVTVTATLSRAINTQTTVALTLGGTAASVDYAVTGTLSVTVAALATTGTTLLTFTPTQDLVYEGDETITVSGTATGLTVTGTTLTLTDDEAVPTVALSVSPESFAEDDAATAVTVTATASGTLASATITLSLAGTAAATDYSAAGTLSITITNSTTGTTVLTFTPTQDLVYEGDETITVSGTATGLTVTGISLTLTDDEAVPTVALSVSPESFAEDDAATAVTVTATASGTLASATIALSLGGTAAATDYSVAGTHSISNHQFHYVARRC